ncbi:uncharacterized protein THITE_154545 [Thermothielavioides terrestris NRRL 8126]|uniref:Uncharacterized protein n=1 Tax=Thermothielavioides terrestris (strain ATCC 38088 / NRRL 8126) TaxID=578455 RepID=G2QW81_THETT|nr:uncharacterized protein THITE_154545 [Thermothielavioides terrestris NRRL 8126]AEO63056.1 hypothetical protein THITE_154545 [Thermothielavioides terrestris NRRL 8126]
MASFLSLSLPLHWRIRDALVESNDLDLPSKLAALSSLIRTCHLAYHIYYASLYRIAPVDWPQLSLLCGAANGSLRAMEHAVACGADINWFGDVGILPDPRLDPGARVTLRHLRDSSYPSIRHKGTALHLAAMMGQDEAVEWLVDHGAKLNAQSRSLCACRPGCPPQLQAWPESKMWHPIHTALCHGQVSTFMTLARKGASIDAVCVGRYRTGRYPTALHLAAYAGNWQIVDYILAHPGAESRVRATVDGKTALQLACQGPHHGGTREGRAYIMRRLVQHGARLGDSAEECEVLAGYLEVGYFGAVVDLLKSGAYPRLTWDACRELLHRTLTPPITFHLDKDRYSVAYAEQRELVRFLAQMGADVNTLWEDDCGGATPLMLAAHPAQPDSVAIEMIKLVLELGGNPTATNQAGMTVLHHFVKTLTDEFTVSEGRYLLPLLTLQYLLGEDVMARLDARDCEGKTALDYVYDALDAGIKNSGGQCAYARGMPLEARFGPGQAAEQWQRQAVRLLEAMLAHARAPIPPPVFAIETERLKTARRRIFGD